MSSKTTIEWTAMPGYVGAVWNPTTGCTRVSAGCDNCYAFALHDKRYAMNLGVAREHTSSFNEARVGAHLIGAARRAGVALPWPKQYDKPFSQVQLLEERLDVPLRVRKPTCYFVDSMADLFHEDVPDDFIDRVWLRMLFARRHRFLILTKRPERMRAFLDRITVGVVSQEELDHVKTLLSAEERASIGDWARDYLAGNVAPAPNVWLGTSVEDQASADERIPHLLATPAAVRFLSCEPLLGPVTLPLHIEEGFTEWSDKHGHDHKGLRPALHWVIAGGESGPRARPMDLAWARSLRSQCAIAGVSFFMKQLGTKPMEKRDLIPGVAEPHWEYWLHPRESHGRDMAEWPEDLRIRTWPR